MATLSQITAWEIWKERNRRVLHSKMLLYWTFFSGVLLTVLFRSNVNIKGFVTQTMMCLGVLRLSIFKINFAGFLLCLKGVSLHILLIHYFVDCAINKALA